MENIREHEYNSFVRVNLCRKASRQEPSLSYDPNSHKKYMYVKNFIVT
jgi:hypothetical protein